MRNNYVLSFALAVLMLAAAAGIRSLAQTANSASKTNSTNVMPAYVEAVQKALISGTEVTNLTDAELSSLLNESIKTNLAAQLWFRQAMIGNASAHGAKMAVELQVLQTLRAGRTKEAIRLLEDGLDSDIILLAQELRAADETKMFKTTSGPLKSLQWARDYRLKFPYKSRIPATDDQVKSGLSYLDQK